MGTRPACILWVDALAPPPRASAALRDHGYTLLHAEPGARAATLCRRLPLDAVILTPGLPDQRQEAQAVRALCEPGGASAPLLVRVPQPGTLHEVLLLEAGADAVVDLEADTLVLLARLRTLLRRTHGRWPAGTALDLRTGHGSGPAGAVHIDGRKLALGASAHALVQALAVHAGQPTSRDQLARHLGPAAAARSPRTVDVAISRLRRVLSAQGVSDLVIEAVRGQGYRLVLRGPAP